MHLFKPQNLKPKEAAKTEKLVNESDSDSMPGLVPTQSRGKVPQSSQSAKVPASQQSSQSSRARQANTSNISAGPGGRRLAEGLGVNSSALQSMMENVIMQNLDDDSDDFVDVDSDESSDNEGPPPLESFKRQCHAVLMPRSCSDTILHCCLQPSQGLRL